MKKTKMGYAGSVQILIYIKINIKLRLTRMTMLKLVTLTET